MAEPDEARASAVEPATPEPSEDERLRRAERAYERGAYAELGPMLQGLVGARSPEVVERVRRLARARALDSVQLAVLGACALVLLAIVIRYVVGIQQ
jgi:hypothetical protein